MQAKINDNTKVWKIPVTYSMTGIIEIKADTLKEAIDIALNDDSIPLPDDAYYIDDSWEYAIRKNMLENAIIIIKRII